MILLHSPIWLWPSYSVVLIAIQMNGKYCAIILWNVVFRSNNIKLWSLWRFLARFLFSIHSSLSLPPLSTGLKNWRPIWLLSVNILIQKFDHWWHGIKSQFWMSHIYVVLWCMKRRNTSCTLHIIWIINRMLRCIFTINCYSSVTIYSFSLQCWCFCCS